MPYSLTWEPQGVYRRYHGDTTAAERHASLEEICGDPRFDNLRWSITDYLAVTTYEHNEADTALVAAKHIGPSLSNPGILIAAVAVREDIVRAIEHFIALGMTDLPYRVFPTVEAARAWIAETRGQWSRPRQR